ncbi:MAG TPA: hypothetical protein VIP28_05060 [Nocardioides sp.]
MPVTDQDARALAYLAARMRPHGARRWDEAGIIAAIGKVKHIALADVALAVVRAADDRTLETPAPIGNLRSTCWRERNANRPAEHKPYVREDTCGTCSLPESECRLRWEDDHEFERMGSIQQLPKEEAVEVVTELKNHVQPLGQRPERDHVAEANEIRKQVQG